MNLRAYNYISEKEYKFLSKHLHSPGTPMFYGQPKIHKFFVRFSPLRPIAPGFNCISASLPEYVDSLKYQAKTWKSYIRGTADFLLKFKSLYTINFHLSHYGRQQPLTSVTRRVLMSATKNWKCAKIKLFHQTTIPSKSINSEIQHFSVLRHTKKWDTNGYLNGC